MTTERDEIQKKGKETKRNIGVDVGFVKGIYIFLIYLSTEQLTKQTKEEMTPRVEIYGNLMISLTHSCYLCTNTIVSSETAFVALGYISQ